LRCHNICWHSDIVIWHGKGNDENGSNFVGGEIPSEIREASRLEIINLCK